MHPKKQKAKLIQIVSFEHIQNNFFFFIFEFNPLCASAALI